MDQIGDDSDAHGLREEPGLHATRQSLYEPMMQSRKP